uniref:Uncharacterized protein n=1 Tax=Rhizoctonia cerealis orthocurvulavirus TaxID=3068670 RepID=A0AA51BS76_9VIRU|nr:MAG: hypothetical protein [Rhizoctonia cerealis orthocurvulavirus]
MAAFDPAAIAKEIQDRFRARPQAPAPMSTTLAGRPTNFENVPTAGEVLPLPDDIEDIAELVELAERYAAVVERGDSLAIFTDYQGTSAKTDSPFELALNSMSPDERQWFEFWRGGAKKLPMDWRVIYKPITGEKDKKETLQSKVNAMRSAWQDPTIQVENWHGLRTMAPELIQIVTAYEKYIAAHNGVKGGVKSLTQLEMQEYQTITHVRATIDEKIQRKMEEINALTRRYAVTKRIIQAREHPLKEKLVGKSLKKDDTLNRARVLRGQAKIGRDMNTHNAPRGSRPRPRRELDDDELDAITAARVKRARRDEPRERERSPALESMRGGSPLSYHPQSPVIRPVEESEADEVMEGGIGGAATVATAEVVDSLPSLAGIPEGARDDTGVVNGWKRPAYIQDALRSDVTADEFLADVFALARMSGEDSSQIKDLDTIAHNAFAVVRDVMSDPEKLLLIGRKGGRVVWSRLKANQKLFFSKLLSKGGDSGLSRAIRSYAETL